MSLKRNTFWNLAGNGLPFLLGAVTIPYLIRHLGVEAFGILTLIWGLIGYFSLFDFGLGRALTQQVAARLATGMLEKIPSLVKSGVLFTGLTGLVGCLLLIGLAQPLALRWLKVSAALQDDTVLCLIVAALGIPLTTLTTGLRGVLEAYEDFRIVNLIKIGLGAGNFGLPAVIVFFCGPSLPWIVVSLVLTRVAVLVVHAMLVTEKLQVPWWRGSASRDDARQLMSFGVWMTVTNVVSPLMVSADRFVIAAILGASAVAYYTVPFEVLIRVLVVPAAISATLFPRLAAHFSTDVSQARALYHLSIRVVTMVLGPICLTIFFGAHWGMSLWLGDAFADRSWLVVSILSVGVLCNGVAWIPFATIQAKGRARNTALLHVTELVAYVPMLLIALHYWGIVGAAVAWSVRTGADMICLMVMAKREFAA